MLPRQVKVRRRSRDMDLQQRGSSDLVRRRSPPAVDDGMATAAASEGSVCPSPCVPRNSLGSLHPPFSQRLCSPPMLRPSRPALLPRHARPTRQRYSAEGKRSGSPRRTRHALALATAIAPLKRRARKTHMGIRRRAQKPAARRRAGAWAGKPPTGAVGTVRRSSERRRRAVRRGGGSRTAHANAGQSWRVVRVPLVSFRLVSRWAGLFWGHAD
jgi:hypothetical protein